MIVVRKAIVAASPATIWKTNFATMEWDKWDPDVVAIEDVEGGMEDGSSLVFVMKDDGMKIKTVISDVTENEKFTFSGGIYGGLVGYKGTFELTPSKEEKDKTNVTYTFGMKGLGGALVSMLNKKAVVGGTEGGLENVKKLSEEAENSGS